jgi:hypothetical protein
MFKNDEANFSLNKFDINSIVDHAAICMVAKRGSGKSWLVRDIMAQKKDIPGGVIIAPTDKLSGFYNDIYPSSYIYYSYDSSILGNIFYRQGLMIDKNKERKLQRKKLVDTRVMLVMDDCLAQKSLWAKDQNILELMQNGRHYHITYMLTMQYSLGISPELRSNFDYIFLLGEDMINNRKKLYDHYAGMFPSFDIFQKVFTHCTNDYGCMVIDNRTRTSDITKKVFWYKARKPKDIEIGHKKFREFHYKNFDKNWNKRIPIFDINSLINKKKKIGYSQFL